MSGPTSPDQGISGVFQLLNFDLGGAVNVLRELMSDTPVEDIELPPGLQNQALSMIMQRYGATRIEEFLGNEEIIGRITEALREDLANNPAEETIIFNFVEELNGEQLKELIVGNEGLQEILEPILQDTIQTRIAAQIESATLQHVLESASAPIEGLPETLLGKKISELTPSDLTELSNEQLSQIIPALPQDIFQSQVLDQINANLPEDNQVTAASGSYADQSTAFGEAIENARGLADMANASGIMGLFTAATNNEDDIENRIFSTIREEIPGALEEMTAALPDIANGQLPEFVTFNNGTYEIDFERITPEQMQNFFEENKTDIARMLKEEDNWPLIAQLITRENLIRHQEEILPHILPEMTQEGLSGFRSMLESLPEELRDIIGGFMNMVIGFLDDFGINLSGPAPDAPNEAPAAPDPSEAEHTTPAPGMVPGQVQ